MLNEGSSSMDETMIAALAADPRSQPVKASLARSCGKSIEGDGITDFLYAVADVGLGKADLSEVLSSLYLYSAPCSSKN
jgi:hypothetical protein